MTKFHATFDDDGTGENFIRAAANLRAQLRDLMQEVADDAELIFSAHALHGETGKLSRGVTSRAVGDAIFIEVHAKSKAGFDYVAVTRFGHRKQWIVPKHPPKAARFYPKTAQAFPLPAPYGFRSSIKGFAALQTPFGFRRRVRGFKPKRDWAAAALPEVQREAQTKLVTFGRGFTARLT